MELTEEEDDISLTEFLRKINVGYEDYKEALQISEKGDVIILKRRVNERFVNSYNPCFAKAWNGNSDLQFCMDMHAVVTYITDYFSKEDRGLTKLLKQAISERKDVMTLKDLTMSRRSISLIDRRTLVRQLTN